MGDWRLVGQGGSRRGRCGTFWLESVRMVEDERRWGEVLGVCAPALTVRPDLAGTFQHG